jgi:hypothetical protein
MPAKASHIPPEASKERFMLPFRFIEISILQQRATRVTKWQQWQPMAPMARQRLRGVSPSLDDGKNV